jgi:cytoskeletal protein RodZ
MTPEKKPEWFQLADADNSASTRKISKGLPIMALVAVAAIIGVGAIFAQPQEQSPANATETVAPAVVNSTQTSAKSETVAPANTDAPGVAPANNDAPAVTSAKKESVAPATAEPTTKAEPVAPKAPAAPGVANPLAKKPKGGEHEGREHGEHEGDDDEGDDD